MSLLIRYTILLVFSQISIKCINASLFTHLGTFLEHLLEESIDDSTLCDVINRLSENDYENPVCIYDKNKKMEPEAYMTTVEVIKNRGYPAEVHEVQTEDGYILGIHRIPHGLSGPSDNRHPVFIQHGILSQSGDWIINFGNQSLGYILADVGYDVWLGNYRGNTYSRKHVSMDPDKDPKFWDFSWQEMGNYDLPACIDYILDKTGFQQLTYIGYSMGATGFLVLTANRTEYNAKIKTMIALAPASSFTTIANTGIVAELKAYAQSIKRVSYVFELTEIFAHSKVMMYLASSACTRPGGGLCLDIIEHLGGLVPNIRQLNSTRKPVYVAHTPAGISAKTLLHYVQLIDRPPHLLRAYDYGFIKNEELYGQFQPPVYNLSLITAPVALFWGQNDGLALPGNVAHLAKSLPNLVLNYRIDNDLWNHVDFMWAIEAEQYLNTKIVSFLKSRA